MAGTALINVVLKVAGVEGGTSLENQIFELAKRFYGTVPTLVVSGHRELAAAATEELGGVGTRALFTAINGIIVFADTGTFEIDISNAAAWAVSDIELGELEATFFKPTYVNGDETYIKNTNGETGAYDYIAFGTKA